MNYRMALLIFAGINIALLFLRPFFDESVSWLEILARISPWFLVVCLVWEKVPSDDPARR